MENYGKVGLLLVAFYLINLVVLNFLDGIFYHEILIYVFILSLLFIFGEGKIPTFSFFLFGLSASLHVIGLYNVGGCDLYLCGINGNYDFLAHILGFFFISFGTFNIYKNKDMNPFFVFLCLFSIGAFIEIGEFLGYTFLGFGSGALKFGQGDSNIYMGAWGDSMTDLIANGLGIILGYFYYLLLKVKFKNKLLS